METHACSSHGSMQTSAQPGNLKRKLQPVEVAERAFIKSTKTEPDAFPQSSPQRYFWDRLSKTWLTRRALKELNRRAAPLRFPRQPDVVLKASSNYSSKELERFARHGGPDLLELRGYPDPDFHRADNMTSSRSSRRSSQLRGLENAIRETAEEETRPRPGGKSAARTSGKKSSAYDQNFEQHLIDNGAFPYGYEYSNEEQPDLPANWDEIIGRMRQSRRPISPSAFSHADFVTFCRTDAQAWNENNVASALFPLICGKTSIPCQQNLLFNNMKAFADGIVSAQPDFYDGARADKLHTHIRTELGPYIIPSTSHHAPILPNFFAELKGAGGLMTVARRQALHDSLLGARGMHVLQSYASEPDSAQNASGGDQRNDLIYDNNAYTIAATYHDGVLKLYALHPTRSVSTSYWTGRLTDYHINQLGAWALTGSLDMLQQGVDAFRNLRDWAKEKRDQFIADANSRYAAAEASAVAATGTGPAGTGTNNHLAQLPETTSWSKTRAPAMESDTSADELASSPTPNTTPSSSFSRAHSESQRAAQARRTTRTGRITKNQSKSRPKSRTG